MSDAFDLMAGLVLDDGRTWGETAADFQRDDARAVCAPTDGGDPRRHFVVRPRGASKTTDVGGVALALLTGEAPRRSRSYVYAADADQAGELLDALAGFVDRTSGLRGAVELGARTVTVRETGATLQVESSDAASSWGKRPWLVICEELTSWPSTANHRRLWSAIVSALPKRRDSRLVVLGMAGAPTHFSAAVWRLAQASPDWRASSVPGPCPWWAPADVAATRALLTQAEFRRYVLCEWVEVDEALSTEADVLACVRHDALEPRRGVRYVLALDVGTRRDLCALAVAHAEARAGGRQVVVDRVLSWRPRPGLAGRVDLGEVEAAVLRTSRAYNGAPLRFDRSQAEQMTQRLVREGVRVDEYVFSQAGANRLAKALYVSLRDRTVDLPDDAELVSELQTARLVETGPGTVKLVNPPGTHDDLAVAVGMCVVHLQDRPTGLPGALGGTALARNTLGTEVARASILTPSGGDHLALVRDGFDPWGER